jgi:predicted DNA-binding WGR domain protein
MTARHSPLLGAAGAFSPSPANRSKPNEGDMFVSNSSGITMRRFEFRRGNANKFWEVTVRANDVMVRYGRIGSNGQAQVKSFKDEQSAALHVAKLIREKTVKGYREVA